MDYNTLFSGGTPDTQQQFPRRLKFFYGILFMLWALPVYGQTPPVPPSAQIPAALFNSALTLDQTIAALDATPGLNGARTEFRWDPFFQGGNFSLGDHYGSFTTTRLSGGTGYFVLDGREVFSVTMPWVEQGRLLFPEPFVRTVKGAFSYAIEGDKTRFRIAAIIIDPGHGGKDPGGVGRLKINGSSVTVVEKDIVLKASQYLKTLLDRTYPGKRIIMTRDSDTYPSLDERPAMANSVPLKDNEAIIYISIHANTSSNSAARGFEVYYLSPTYRRNVIDHEKYTDSPDLIPILNDMLEEEYTRESIDIAQSILDSFQQTMGKTMPSRGLKADDFVVVKKSRMPAVLVELGFVTNPQDALLMTSDTHLRKLTEAVYKGIVDFVSIFERSGGFIAAQ
ncbi:MAG: N-acetylmuramoyl-L-alanine amidase [Treponema sp.]|jgi:N-acetylmuramoyl-L-alanine amidase|nr:N-acetylmuramoyl-L-alanine amidase [Treponema sp.]